MSSLDRFESRTPWLAFPGLFRYIIWLQALVAAASLMQRGIGAKIGFNFNLILQGEVWRIFSQFATSPFSSGLSGNILLIIFLIFYVLIGTMFSDTLEARFGAWRMSAFIYTSLITITLGQVLVNQVYPEVITDVSGFFLYESVFLLFAATFPLMKLNLFGILPVPIFILGLLVLLRALLEVLESPAALVFLSISFAPTIACCIPLVRDVLKERQRTLPGATPKRAPAPALHECHTCGRTENSDPNLIFRVAADGEEYCEQHLPPKSGDRA